MKNALKALAYGCMAFVVFGLYSCEDDQEEMLQVEGLNSEKSDVSSTFDRFDTTLVNDMVMPENSLRSCFVNSKKWTYEGSRKYISFKFLGNPTELQKKYFRTYLMEWMSYANLTFKEVTSSSKADVRVKFADGVTDKGGNWSYVGSDARLVSQSEPTIHFQYLDENYNQSIWSRKMLHEMGHMLGLVHEHQSPNSTVAFDTNEVYKWGRTQGWSDEETNQNVLMKYSSSSVTATSFDPNSIMLYALPAKCYKSKKAPVENYLLSQSDKDMIRNMYPFKGFKRLYRCYIDYMNGVVVNRHFYTTDFNELYVGSNPLYVESSMGLVYDEANKASNTKMIYRFWNQAINDHFYTSSVDEYKHLIAHPESGYAYVGTAGRAYAKSTSNTNTVYRYVHKTTGEHFFTIFESERSLLPSLGFTYEGIAFYTIKE